MSLHMIRLDVRRPGLVRFARDTGLPLDDEGYLLHAALRAAFGAAAPQPFALIDAKGERPAHLLGYGPTGADGLRETLAIAAPTLDATFDLGSLEAKAMPAAFREDAIYGFEVRTCPVVRQSRRGDGARGHREIDAFLHATLAVEADVPVDREAVYCAWVSERLRLGGVEPLTLAVQRLDQAPLVRRRHRWNAAERSQEAVGPAERLQRRAGGRQIFSRRPDVTFRGTLRITDPDRFHALLARGVGRHRAFGFGMLLLRPA